MHTLEPLSLYAGFHSVYDYRQFSNALEKRKDEMFCVFFMNFRHALIVLFIGGLLALYAFPSLAAPTKELKASLAAIPTLIDSPEKGPFVDLVKAIASNAGAKLEIDVFPFARSVDTVINGKADFHVPAIRNRSLDESALPYQFVDEKMGIVCFVIYSNTEKPITAEMIASALASGKPFPYQIEGPGGLELVLGFPTRPSNNVVSSLQMISKKRVDALVWAQEEVDAALKNLKLPQVHREHWRDLDDSIIVAKGTHGDEINSVLSAAMKKMHQTGELDRLHSLIHHAYDVWQPADMGW